MSVFNPEKGMDKYTNKIAYKAHSERSVPGGNFPRPANRDDRPRKRSVERLSAPCAGAHVIAYFDGSRPLISASARLSRSGFPRSRLVEQSVRCTRATRCTHAQGTSEEILGHTAALGAGSRVRKSCPRVALSWDLPLNEWSMFC